MKAQNVLLIALFTLLFSACQKQVYHFETDQFKFEIDGEGNVSTLFDKVQNKEYLSDQQVSPLLAIRVNNEYENPGEATWNEAEGILSLTYPKNQATLLLSSKQHKEFVSFEVKEAKSEKEIELVVWGPYATTISQTVGECVGVVRDNSFAIGIQGLNPKTMGGYPSTEDDVDPNFDIFATTSLVDVADSLKILYRGQTAKHTEFGSVLQAYCRNRTHDREVSMWNNAHQIAKAYNDGGVIGSKLAIFGCPSEKALDHIEAIELAENLPHPELNGVWMKKAPGAAQAYIIYPFNEKNIDEAIAFTKQTGLKYLYHGGPFETWGTFKLNPAEFPSGMDGLKKCVETAGKQGIKLGLHTLSNFITTNDPMVTPVPSKHLAQVGTSTLQADITATTTTLEIADPRFFDQSQRNNNLHTVMIGEELIRYESVSESAPWKLLNCERGAWGTKAASHAKNSEVAKLLDHGYKTFLSDAELTKEIARNIANIFNKTGIEQISFDGLEGNWSTGLGQYGLSLMMKEWYDNLLPQYRNVINDASITTHYNWHTFTRMNWGEPWYAGFRESQMNYRLMNQDFYRRNLIPCMLGWFKLDANTGIEDIEWLLARSAAFDAGYTLVTNGDKVKQNGLSDQIVKAIREWENARLCGAFPKELKQEMEHVANEYTLKENSAKSWTLYPYQVQRFKHQNKVLQPGEPVVSKWEFDNKNDRQPLQFLLKANDRISKLSLEIANYSTVTIDCTLEKGQYLKYLGDDHFIVYDKNWNEVKRIAANKDKMNMPKGKSSLVFACLFKEVEDVEKYATIEFKTVGKAMELTATREKSI